MKNSRRDFLQKLAASAVAIPLIPSFLSTASPRAMHTNGGDNHTLRVALMGLGNYATTVAEAMQACKRAKLVGVVSGTPTKIRTWQEKYGIPPENCYNYENFDRMKDNPEIDAVYVITPNALHHEQVIRSARAGKHVICEKPMAINAQQGKEMAEVCNQEGVKLLIGYRMRFEPKTLEIIRMRTDGELGKIMFFQGLSGFRMDNPNQWRLDKMLSGGGSLMDIGIYAVNGARYMVGEDPIWVTAQETKTNPVIFKEGIDETIQFQLGFESGATASCLSTYNMNHLDRFYLNGEKGFAELHPATGYGPIKGRTHQGELTQPHITHQTLQMDGMAEIILDGKQPVVPVNGEDGVKDLKITDAIYRACKTGDRQTLQW